MTRARSRKRGPPQDGLVARRAALALYLAVITDARALDEAFTDSITNGMLAGCAPRDRAFARRLATTALRRRGQALTALGRFLSKGSLRPKATALEAILVQGLVEISVLGTPVHAALDCAVSLARDHAKTAGFASLVNAVLRRVARELSSPEALAKLAPPTANLPDWLRVRWTEQFGADTTEAIAVALATEPPLDFTVKGDATPWRDALNARELPNGTLRRALGGRIEELPGYEEGAWWVQDAAASLPVHLLGGVAGAPVLDLCAAPGGKTAQLAAAGARVTALDKDPNRLARLQSNLQRLSLSATLVAADARNWRPPERFPFVLLDAPCTATGTLRRHPDGLWLKRAGDIETLARTQSELLDAALTLLTPGGTLVYAVCSLEPEEGPAQIEAALARHPEVTRKPVADGDYPWADDFLTPAGDLFTTPAAWPAEGGLDGFYIARLTRG